jgi:peroxiredoxin
MKTKFSWLLLFAIITAQPVWAEKTLKAQDGRLAPAFTLPGVDGAQHALADYRGKFVLINFWAVWCPPCRKEMPSMQRLYDMRKGDDFELLAVHIGPNLAKASEFAQKHGLSFPVLVDADMALTAWKLRGLPTTFLLDPQGKILAKASGERDWDSPAMLRTLQEYMNQPVEGRVLASPLPSGRERAKDG